MKLVIIGGTGLIGSKLVAILRAGGHEAVPASPNTGVNTLTGEGLAAALQDASVIVDVSNAPSFEETAVMEFFSTATRNLIAAGQAAGVTHYVALSVVGTERLTDSGYFRAKLAQERLIRESSLAWSIVHATQFYEFIDSIAAGSTVNGTVRVPPALIQPIAADDVAAAMARVATGSPLNGTVEIAGPREYQFEELIREALGARHDPRHVVTDPQASYFGSRLEPRTLLPGDGARLGALRLAEWLHQPTLQH